MANSSNSADMHLYVPTPEEIEKSLVRARRLRAEYIASFFTRSASAKKDAPIHDAPIRGAATA